MAKKKTKLLDSAGGYDLAAAVYDKKLSFLNGFEQGKLLPMTGDVKGKKILDVGAGTGRISLSLASAGGLVTALDVSAKMLDILKKKNKKIEIMVADAENLPFSDSSFDLVVAAFLIVHLSDLKIFFSEAHRVLKDGGRFIVTNINQRRPPVVETSSGPIEVKSYYHRPEYAKEEMENAGFSILKNEMIFENGVWINQILVGEK